MSEPPTDINSLISQLQGINNTVNNIDELSQQTSISKENLEQFIIDKASQLVNDTTSTIAYLKRLVEAAPDAKEVASLAELVKASSSTLDTLTKMVISDKKNNTIKELKQLDMAIKQKPEALKNKYTRDEIFKQLFEPATGTVVEINSQPEQQVENIN